MTARVNILAYTPMHNVHITVPNVVEAVSENKTCPHSTLRRDYLYTKR